jgi:hypothetical protein
MVAVGNQQKTKKTVEIKMIQKFSIRRENMGEIFQTTTTE